jgi:hypothetical protein
MCLAALATMLAACSDPAGPVSYPMALGWMEWPAVVTAGSPGHLLAQVVTDFCSDQSISITANLTEVIVDARSTPRGPVCPLGAPPAFPSDTLLPLPRLAMPSGQAIAYYTMRATLLSPRGEAINRIVGPIALAGVADTTRYMAGLGVLGPDSAGCDVLTGGGFGVHRYAVINPPAALAGDTVVATVGAHVVTTPPPAACGALRAVHLDFIEAEIYP